MSVPTILTEAAASSPPEIALVVGSGISPLTGRLRVTRSVPFVEVPGLAAPSVASHKGLITFGNWAGKRLLVFDGRLHYYEGHPWERVELAARLAAHLGARLLLLTNAAGGIRDDLVPGSFMAIRDHLEWTRPYCWRLPGFGALGPPRQAPYAPRLFPLLAQAARAVGVPLPEGIYAAVTGPCYETPAEIRAMKCWGADAVGMSTAREAQAGHDCGLECAALSCITNRAAGLGTGPITHEEVLAATADRCAILADLIEAFLRLL